VQGSEWEESYEDWFAFTLQEGGFYALLCTYCKEADDAVQSDDGMHLIGTTYGKQIQFEDPYQCKGMHIIH
jgi:hypothetical protein